MMAEFEEVSQATVDVGESYEPKQLAWFIIHTYSGYEGKVKESLLQRIVIEERSEYFGDIEIPEETYEEMKTDAKTGKKERVLKKRKSFPGYLLIQIAVTKKGSSYEISDTDWHLVRNTPKVTSFVSANKKQPSPLTDEEVRQIMNHTEETQERPKPKFSFEKGEKVRIIDGPFANFEGDVDEIHEERSTIKVMVTVFGRSTPVELDFIQVEKR
ncbi:MAG: transcription termination/antitermination protein NusG [Holophagaceae bacterium]|nr:transcription termination/antitermination protein NusG [Holophagaceae bacterium]